MSHDLDCTFYLEEVVNGEVERMQLFVVREGEEGIILIQPHNFTEVTSYRPGQFDVSELDNIPREQFLTREECEISFMRTESNVYVGTFPDCHRYVGGSPVKYAFTLSCHTIDAIVYWTSSREESHRLPYDHRLIQCFTYPEYMAKLFVNFKPPCDYRCTVQ
ncbi:uncharacterized protein LOC131950265 [Physella acuta]|uniref:uncharacterized protein LOC131950265 n=1 Tax=Physella acuta TaxID=109671 RepID=UPI0027DBDB2D|nr:uncharacterized protein LOC131950265 [Physella acuta]